MSESFQVAAFFIIEYLTHNEWPFSEGEDAEKIISRHIKRLHQYNEAKDATQVCLLLISQPFC
jgi:hypothetical protein